MTAPTIIRWEGLARKHVLYLRRYAFNTVGVAIEYLVIMLVVIHVARLLGTPDRVGGALDELLASSVVGFLAIETYSRMALGVVREAQEGTLEQLAMASPALDRTLLAQASVQLVTDTGLMFGSVALVTAATGQHIHLAPLTLVPLLVVTMVGVMGIGLAVTGCALVFKEIASLIKVLQYALLIPVLLPSTESTWTRLVPLTWGKSLVARAMADGETIVEIGSGAVLLLVAVSAAHLAGGLWLFARLVEVARRRGVLGHY